MKRSLCLLLAVVMLLSMLPVAAFAEEGEVLFSGTNVTASADAPVVHTWTAEANGTLTVHMAATKPGWRFEITDRAGNTVGLPKSSSLEKVNTYELTAGETYTYTATGFNSSTWDVDSANITYTLSFLADAGEAPVEKTEYAVAESRLALGENTVTMLDTAVTTIFVFEPSETAVYTITAPQGAVVGYWGAGSWFLQNPNATTNTCEWTCTGVGQTAYIGVSGVEGSVNIQVEKTGSYEVVEIPIVPYENKATLERFTLPEGASLGGYVDVLSDTVHTAVLGADGYYHLDSADGAILLIDLDYMDIILSAALLSDRPVMYAYVEDENGQTIKYDIGNAIKAYEEVMDVNGYYPVTEDILLFYQVYAMGAGTFTYHLTGMNYNEECVWMYCMRTMELATEVAAVYENGNQIAVYTSVADAIAACGQGQYVVLIENVNENLVISGDVYLDLNGKTLTGSITGTGTLYGMDSATNDYDCSDMGQIMGMVSCNVESVNENNVTGEVMKYLTISGMNGISFHRFYVGITYVNLNPSAVGFGYKAVFAGDEMVQRLLDSFGFSMWLGGNAPIERVKTADQFVSGKVVTLLLKNYDVVNFGEQDVSAQVFMQLTDGTKLVSAVCAYSMREVVETINANVSAYTAEQIHATATMILSSDVMQTWEVANILKPIAKVEEIVVENEEMMIYDLLNNQTGNGTFTLDAAYTFTAMDTPETVVNNPYANWIADYYVSVDQVVQEGLYLAGNYGAFGWLALPVPAGQSYTDFALLTNTLGEWTYTDIVEQVGVFSCGAADADGNNAGATIKVELRVVNPKDATDFLVLNCIELPL